MTARILQADPLPLSDTSFVQDLIASFKTNTNTVLFEEVRTKRSYRFEDVYRMASGVARKLQELGQKAGDVVTVASNVCAESLTTICGVWLSGAASSPLNPVLPIGELQYFLNVNKSRVVFAGEEFLARILEAVKGLEWEVTVISPNGVEPAIDYFSILETDDLIEEVDQPLGKDHPTAIMFTSGTTGVPKGVIIRDEAVKFFTRSHAELHKELALKLKNINGSSTGEASLLAELSDQISPGKYMMSSPLYWISNPMLLCVNVCNGGTILVADRLKPEELLQAITEHKPERWFTGPSSLIDMCNLPNLEDYDTSSVIDVMVGGATVLAEHKKYFCEKLFGGRFIIKTGYGSTEGGMITLDPEGVDVDSPRFGSIGKVVKGVVVKIVDTTTGEIVEPYVPGEICVKSPAVLKGYLNRELTEKEKDPDGFWHMGDIGYYDEEGYIFYQARMKDVMKYRGQQIAPAELEAVIQKHPEIIESAVVGKPSPEYGELPTAFVVKRPDSNLTEQELFDFVSNEVIDEKKLRGGIYFVDSLPKSPVGKILRRDLLKLLSA